MQFFSRISRVSRSVARLSFSRRFASVASDVQRAAPDLDLRSTYSYDLPQELIAQFPQPNRSSSRLLALNGRTGQLQHRQFADILEFIDPGDLLVFNNTRVIPARLFGKKRTGGNVEIMTERVLTPTTLLAFLRNPPKASASSKEILLEGGHILNLVSSTQNDGLCLLELTTPGDIMDILNQQGQMPLPPYMKRAAEDTDKERYQTVYASVPGAVAAPTAGLHFDQHILNSIKAKGASLGYVTLHVGSGTFLPVRSDRLSEHTMHSEFVEVSPELCDMVQATKKAGKRVIAVGTTSVRSLESACRAAADTTQSTASIRTWPLAGSSTPGSICPFTGNTRIFIKPGYTWGCVDALVTNFHLPESTLLVLVSSFAGFENTMNAYREAVKEKYRFFSYGDAMFITPQTPSGGATPSPPPKGRPVKPTPLTGDDIDYWTDATPKS